MGFDFLLVFGVDSFGFESLENLSVGFVYNVISDLLLIVDFYYVVIKDRIIFGSLMLVDDVLFSVEVVVVFNVIGV